MKVKLSILCWSLFLSACALPDGSSLPNGATPSAATPKSRPEDSQVPATPPPKPPCSAPDCQAIPAVDPSQPVVTHPQAPQAVPDKPELPLAEPVNVPGKMLYEAIGQVNTQTYPHSLTWAEGRLRTPVFSENVRPFLFDQLADFISASQILYSRKTADGVGLFRQELAHPLPAAELIPHTERQLTATTVYGNVTSWSISGKNLVLIKPGSDAKVNDIWLGRADGTHLLNITSDTAAYSQVSWSPDGSQFVALERQPSPGTGDPYRFKLWLFSAAGEKIRALAEDVLQAQWSPDGSQLALTQRVDSRFQLFTIRPDGRNRHQLTDGSQKALAPSWSPDGSRILYLSRQDLATDEGTIIEGKPTVIDSHSGAVLGGTTRFVSAAVWSPDGSQMAYITHVDGGGKDVFISQLDGSGAVNVSQSPDQDEISVVWHG